MEACLLEGKLHYRVMRMLPSGAELKVWYDKDLAAVLSIPELQPAFMKGQYTKRDRLAAKAMHKQVHHINGYCSNLYRNFSNHRC